jgi:excinuclease UvrABC ATPase subunit
MTNKSGEALFHECSNCKATGSHFETPEYRPMSYGEMHSGKCTVCDGRGIKFTDEGRRIFDLIDALRAYPKARQNF